MSDGKVQSAATGNTAQSAYSRQNGRTFSDNESVRTESFSTVWTDELGAAFAEIATYYDGANRVASLGLLNSLKRKFIDFIDVGPKDKLLDVCAGTMEVSLALLEKQPDLEAHAVDRSEAMLAVGTEKSKGQGVEISTRVSDVHKLPFPDNSFDVVTLQFASRHLRIIEVFEEIQRVLVPGGHFYHCDMLRPSSKVVESAYYLYLWACLGFLSWAFRSSKAAVKSQDYFIDAIRLFYSTDELSHLLSELGYSNIVGKSVMGGAVAFHRACKVNE